MLSFVISVNADVPRIHHDDDVIATRIIGRADGLFVINPSPTNTGDCILIVCLLQVDDDDDYDVDDDDPK
jgi:hypothetical protein